MDWIHYFHLFLFDFDGLLVNTEHLHFQAYVNMLEKRGYRLDWSLNQFCSLAHASGTAIREAVYAEFPDLESNWPMLYEEKKQAYQDLLASGKVELMPGAERLLHQVEQANLQRCVVTNSSFEQIQAIRLQLPVLQSIPHWITRENYLEPKPNSECYLRAIQLFGKPKDRIIGFEDTPKGIQALQGTSALPVLICPSHHPLLGLLTKEVIHFPSLEEIPSDWSLIIPIPTNNVLL